MSYQAPALQSGQSAPARGTGVSSPITVTFAQAPKSGNLLVAVISLIGQTAQGSVSSITQTGVTWTKQVGSQYSGYYVDCEIWAGVVGSGAGTSASVALSGGSGALSDGCVIDVCEWTNLKTSSFLDKTASSDADANTATGTTASTTQLVELCIGAMAAYDVTQVSATNGFTLLDGAIYGTNSAAYLYKVVFAEGAQSSATADSTGWADTPYAGCIATFFAATNAAGTVTPYDASNAAVDYASISGPSTETVGNDQITGGGSDGGSDSGYVMAQQFMCSYAGTLTDLYLYVEAAAGTGMVAVYSDSGSTSPASLLGSSSSQTLANGWNHFSGLSINLSANTLYWLCFEVSSSTVTPYVVWGVGPYYNIDYWSQTYGSFPSSAGSSVGTEQGVYCFYGVLTLSSPHLIVSDASNAAVDAASSSTSTFGCSDASNAAVDFTFITLPLADASNAAVDSITVTVTFNASDSSNAAVDAAPLASMTFTLAYSDASNAAVDAVSVVGGTTPTLADASNAAVDSIVITVTFNVSDASNAAVDTAPLSSTIFALGCSDASNIAADSMSIVLSTADASNAAVDSTIATITFTVADSSNLAVDILGKAFPAGDASNAAVESFGNFNVPYTIPSGIPSFFSDNWGEGFASQYLWNLDENTTNPLAASWDAPLPAVTPNPNMGSGYSCVIAANVYWPVASQNIGEAYYGSDPWTEISSWTGQNSTEVWTQQWVYVPAVINCSSINLSMLTNQQDYPFLALQINPSTGILQVTYWIGEGYTTVSLGIPCPLGQWIQITTHAKCAATVISCDGAYEIWIGTQQIFVLTGVDNYYDSESVANYIAEYESYDESYGASSNMVYYLGNVSLYDPGTAVLVADFSQPGADLEANGPACGDASNLAVDSGVIGLSLADESVLIADSQVVGAAIFTADSSNLALDVLSSLSSSLLTSDASNLTVDAQTISLLWADHSNAGVDSGVVGLFLADLSGSVDAVLSWLANVFPSDASNLAVDVVQIGGGVFLIYVSDQSNLTVDSQTALATVQGSDASGAAEDLASASAVIVLFDLSNAGVDSSLSHAAFSLSEQSSSVDLILARLFGLADFCSGSDLAALLLGFSDASNPASDSVSSQALFQALLNLFESSSALDSAQVSSLSRLFSVADVSEGLDSSVLAAVLALFESASGSDYSSAGQVYVRSVVLVGNGVAVVLRGGGAPIVLR